jgi:hypothetical protein
VSTFDPVALERRVAELEAQLSAPGFWDDQQNAAKVSAEHARSRARSRATGSCSATIKTPRS